MYLYSVYDKKAQYFAPPFAARNNGEALRMFQMLVNDKNTTPGKYPEDYNLAILGEFDDVSGKVVPNEQVVILGEATEYVKAE